MRDIEPVIIIVEVVEDRGGGGRVTLGCDAAYHCVLFVVELTY